MFSSEQIDGFVSQSKEKAAASLASQPFRVTPTYEDVAHMIGEAMRHLLAELPSLMAAPPDAVYALPPTAPDVPPPDVHEHGVTDPGHSHLHPGWPETPVFGQNGPADTAVPDPAPEVPPEPPPPPETPPAT